MRTTPTAAIVGSFTLNNCSSQPTIQTTAGINSVFLYAPLTTTGPGGFYNAAATNYITLKAEI
jgi:hypothetical protein